MQFHDGIGSPSSSSLLASVYSRGNFSKEGIQLFSLTDFLGVVKAGPRSVSSIGGTPERSRRGIGRLSSSCFCSFRRWGKSS